MRTYTYTCTCIPVIHVYMCTCTCIPVTFDPVTLITCHPSFQFVRVIFVVMFLVLKWLLGGYNQKEGRRICHVKVKSHDIKVKSHDIYNLNLSSCCCFGALFNCSCACVRSTSNLSKIIIHNNHVTNSHMTNKPTTYVLCHSFYFRSSS